jgi:hypothetical protein
LSASARADTFKYVDEKGAEQTVEARLYGSGQGAHALLQRDGRLLVIPEQAVQKRDVTDGPAPVTADEMVAILQEKFGADRVRVQVQKPFVVALVLAGSLDKRYDTRIKGFLQKAARFMNNVESTFEKFAADMRFPLRDPEFPLVLVVFESDEDFNKYALESTGGAGLSADHIAGFYSKLTNWLAIRLEECRTFQVPLHEAIHQQVYNRVFQRLAPIPAWFDEGIATGFESSGDRIDVHPAKINSLYASLARNKALRDVSFTAVIDDDGTFHGDILAAQSYIQAWSLHWMLVTQHADRYQTYVQQLASREPLQPQPAEERTKQFEEAFGVTAGQLQGDFPRVLESGLKRQRVKFPDPPQAGVTLEKAALGEAQVRATVDVASGQLHVEGTIRNSSPIRPLTFYVAVVTETGVYTDWVVPNLANGKAAPLPHKIAAKVLPGALGGTPDKFVVRVRSVLPESAEAAEWQREPPLPIKVPEQ